MSSKSAVKLVVPEDDQSSLYRWVAILTGSKNALKGVGFFLGGLLLTLLRIPDRRAGARGTRARRPARHLKLDARTPRPPGQDREVHADVLQQPRGQHPCRRAHLPVRGPRRVVRRRPAVLPLLRAGLELLGGRDPPRRVGDRLRRRPGSRTALRPPPRPRLDRRARRQDRCLAGARRRSVPRSDGRGPGRRASTRRRDRRRD